MLVLRLALAGTFCLISTPSWAQAIRQLEPRDGYDIPGYSFRVSGDGKQIFRRDKKLFGVVAPEDLSTFVRKKRLSAGALLEVSADGGAALLAVKKHLEIRTTADFRRVGRVRLPRRLKDVKYGIGPKGRRLAVLANTEIGKEWFRVVEIFDAKGKKIHRLQLPREYGNDAKFSPDGRHLLVGHRYLYETEGWTRRAELPVAKIPKRSTFSGDGQRLLVDGKLYDVNEGRLIRELGHGKNLRLRTHELLSHDGRIIIGAHRGGIVSLHEVDTDKLIARFDVSRRSGIDVYSLYFAEPLAVLITYNMGKTKVWDLSDFFGDSAVVAARRDAADKERQEVGCLAGDCDQGRGRLRTSAGVVYEGTFENGMLVGKSCRIMHPDGTILEGVFVAGHLHGKGKHWRPDRFHYEGHFANGRRSGRGHLVVEGGLDFKGMFDAGKPKHGAAKFANGDSYYGDLDERGRATGRRCRYQYANGDTYFGRMQKGVPMGHGIMEYADGRVFKGHFKGKVWDGSGKLTQKDGTVVRGSWNDGKKYVPAKRRPRSRRTTASSSPKPKCRPGSTWVSKDGFHNICGVACPRCNGTGQLYSRAKRAKVYSKSMIMAGDKNWFRGYTHYLKDTGRVEYVGGGYRSCSMCRGVGYVDR